MAPKSKLEAHPQRENIINWLYQGVSVRDVEHRLNQIYPGAHQQHLRVSFSTLQNFRKHFLNLEDEVLQDIKEVEALTKEAIKHEAIQAEVQKTSAYKEKINEIVDNKLEVSREIIKAFSIIESRIEALYNKIKATDNIDGFVDTKTEKLFQGYLDQFRGILTDHKKYIEGYKETTDINVNVSIMTDQVSQIREAVREVLADLDPQMAVRFMEKLNHRMRSLEYHEQDYEGMLETSNDG